MNEGQKVKAILGRHKGRKGVVDQVLLPENNYGENLVIVKFEDDGEKYFVNKRNLLPLREKKDEDEDGIS